MTALVTVSSIEDIAALRACEQLIYLFAWHLDSGSPATAIAGLFTEDGIWELPAGGRRVEGRDGLIRYFGGFSKKIVSRRVCSNVIFQSAGPKEIRATSYFSTFRVDGVPERPGPLPVPPVTQVGVYTDLFRRVDGTWLIHHRSTDAIFTAPMPLLDPAAGGS